MDLDFDDHYDHYDDFNCKQKDHEKEQYMYICINSQCQEQHKFFCSDCVLSSYHFKKEFESNNLLKVKDLMNSKQPFIDVLTNLDKKIKEIFLNSLVPKNQLDQIDAALDQFRELIIVEIDKIKNNIKNSIQQNQLISLSLNDRILQNYDLSNITNIVSQLQNGKQYLQQANQEINSFFTSQQRENEEKNIIATYNNQNNKQDETTFQFEFDTLKTFQTQFLQQIKEMDDKLLTKKLLQNKDFKIYKKPGCKSLFTQTFSRTQRVKISFKILEDNLDPNLFVGVQGERQDQQYRWWGQNGNQLCLKKYATTVHSYSTFNVVGKPPCQIYQVGNVYEIEIFVKDNIFDVQDSNRQTIITNTKQFEENIDKWVFSIMLDGEKGEKKVQFINLEISEP